MIVLELSKENIRLAAAEAIALLKIKKPDWKLDNNFLIIKNKKINEKKGNNEAIKIKKLIKRLAFTRKAYTLLFECSIPSLPEKIKKYNWNKAYRQNCAVRLKGKSHLKLEEIAPLVLKKIKNPKVNLSNPKTQFTFFFGKKAYAAILKTIPKHSFEERKANKLPGLLPIAMSPKLAAAAINLTGIEKGTLLDPFCGTGGILIEASLMGLKPIGYDIDREILKKCKKNIDFLKIKNINLENRDSLKWNTSVDYVVTDLPYGMNTKKIKNNFYKEFLKVLKGNLQKKAVIIFPHNLNYRKLIKDAKLKIENEFSMYIHKSLTRRIVVVKQKE
ncbi:MAG TPA: DNA methyltransferase [Candidatus Nanoarchaeia archaeon]|nr:DNA methyltransferase [Candidatus Nanoarchaeia archaeon]